MEIAEATFSERAVQDELERIRTQHFERGEYEQAAQACEGLIEKFPQSKWAGNAYLLAAHCYHELGRSADEARILENFLAAFPQHVQAVTVRKALEELQQRYEQRVRDGAHPAALKDVEGRLQRLYEGLHDLKQRQEHLEELSRSVALLAEQVDELKAKAQLLAADIGGESGEATVLELVNALIQDLRAEVDAQRKRMDARLVAVDATIEDLKARFKSATRVLWASMAAAFVAFAMLIGSIFQSHSYEASRAEKRAAGPASVRVRIVPGRAPATPATRVKATQPQEPSRRKPAVSAKPREAEPAASTRSARLKPQPASVAPPARIQKDSKGAQGQAASPQPSTSAYTVKPGDTLWGICSKVLGNPRAVNEVAAMNGLKGPDASLRPGQVLRLPAPAESKTN